MRILILSNLYPPNVVGGYERLCFEVTSALAAAEHQVTVLTSTYGAERAEYPNQRVVRELHLLTGGEIYVPFGGTPEEREAINRDNIQVASRVLEETRPDVVFAWNLFFLDGGLLDVVQRLAPRTVVMLTDNWLLVQRNPHFVAEFFRTVVHGEGTMASAPPPPPPVRPGLLRRLFGPAPKPELEAVFGSEFVRSLYAAGGIVFPDHRVIHNGVRQLPDPGDTAPDRMRLVRPGTLRLLFAGRLVDLKGAHTAVDAMPLLHPAGLDVERVELTLLGDVQDAAYMAVLQEAIDRSGCADRILMRSTVPEDALPALFAEYDIYLFPSLYEPFSLTLIHAMALGIPTVASRAGGNVEIVEDGESGLLFPKGDAAALAGCVRRLATDGALRARIAAGGRRSAARFTFERMVREMSAFLGAGGGAGGR